MASRSFSVLMIGLLLTGVSLFPVEKSEASEKPDGSSPSFVHYHAPDTLAYDELLEISATGQPTATLRLKLDTLLSVPFISNEANASSAAVELARSDKLGSFIRVGSWNIQRGAEFDRIKAALENPELFERQVKAARGSDKFKRIIQQLDTLRSVDVLALNEVDLGLKRTQYRDVAREMAAALKMNYAFGVEFVEVDPVNLGTEQFKEVSNDEKRAGLRQLIEVDKGRYRGLHGTAILSRFPIKRATLVPFKYQAYDWYTEEKSRISLAEAARRQLGRMAFLQETPREVRLGGRSLLVAELDVPQLPEGTMTVAATHLESRCGPEERRRQMQEALSLIKEVKGPLALVGDFNTSGSNTRPTSIRGELMRRVKDKNFWIKLGINTVAPLGPAFDFLMGIASFARTVHDPTARGIFLFGPNKEAGIFKDLEGFRFSDGYAFDFRGDPERSINKTGGTLANSNSRSHKKGFITTYSLDRSYWAVGKNKLDWILIKAYARNPRGKSEPYRLAPHFAQTLEELNYSTGRRFSDHNPITVDLPVEEPTI
ncbi:MAG TPA: endonuclease/exonuclease/phosphatase family protein [Blastocatellia bacterium]|jgi:endonuclease/exonuclease/phosphatase family metal-dependent hydrolase|nr:endonuclease/exonuclease/phosphatase family protein [Blastocatellia bacterium]